MLRSLGFVLAMSLVGLVFPACSDDGSPPVVADGHLQGDGHLKGDGHVQGDGKIAPHDGMTPTPDGGGVHDGTVPKFDGVIPHQDGSGPHPDGGCINQCTVKAKQCAANGWQACEMQANGCTDWGTVTACKSGEICSGGQCMKNCINQCSVGAHMCSGAGFATCAMQATGCTDWGTVTACKSGEICNGGQCVKNCVNQCAQGKKQCSGTGVQTCDLVVATGCTDWGNPVPCNAGEICSGGTCVKNCSDQCSVNTTRCSGPQLQTCKTMASGCTDWDTPAPCATGSCVNGKCDSGTCQKGEKRCNGTTVEECDAGGFWLVVQACPQACDKGVCTTTVTCSPVTRRCHGDLVEECNPTGTAWLYLEACPNGCTGGLCTGGCIPAATRCNGKAVESCKSDGSGWQVDTTCSQTFCTMLSTGGAACAELELKMDNTTQTLDGEHVYAGDVVLKNNSAITVGSKGWLRIRAKNIDIDATSSITAPHIGDDPAGRGRSRTTKSCYYYGTRNYTVGGSGGGYGAAGVTATYSSGCAVYLNGGAANGGFIADVRMGSRGGSCTNANGGGMIDLIATQTM
ncbi:MAG: hypothetical protein KAI47_03935, partial [Deltaproteobacteria bacterium]|nr:hypothetical protein [Deltaproteobacteria bacterium]